MKRRFIELELTIQEISDIVEALKSSDHASETSYNSALINEIEHQTDNELI